MTRSRRVRYATVAAGLALVAILVGGIVAGRLSPLTIVLALLLLALFVWLEFQ